MPAPLPRLGSMNCKDAKLETKYLPSDLSDKLRHSAGIPADKNCKMLVTLFFWERKMLCCFLYWTQFTGWLDSDARPAVDVVHGEHVVHAPARDQVAAWREGRGHHPRRLQGDHLCHEAWSPPFLKHMTTNLLSTCILLPVQESQTINFPSRDPLTCSWWLRLRCHTFFPCHNNSHIFVQNLRSQ